MKTGCKDIEDKSHGTIKTTLKEVPDEAIISEEQIKEGGLIVTPTIEMPKEEKKVAKALQSVPQLIPQPIEKTPASTMKGRSTKPTTGNTHSEKQVVELSPNEEQSVDATVNNAHEALKGIPTISKEGSSKNVNQFDSGSVDSSLPRKTPQRTLKYLPVQPNFKSAPPYGIGVLLSSIDISVLGFYNIQKLNINKRGHNPTMDAALSGGSFILQWLHRFSIDWAIGQGIKKIEKDILKLVNVDTKQGVLLNIGMGYSKGVNASGKKIMRYIGSYIAGHGTDFNKVLQKAISDRNSSVVIGVPENTERQDFYIWVTEEPVDEKKVSSRGVQKAFKSMPTISKGGRPIKEGVTKTNREPQVTKGFLDSSKNKKKGKGPDGAEAVRDNGNIDAAVNASSALSTGNMLSDWGWGHPDPVANALSIGNMLDPNPENSLKYLRDRINYISGTAIGNFKTSARIVARIAESIVKGEFFPLTEQEESKLFYDAINALGGVDTLVKDIDLYLKHRLATTMPKNRELRLLKNGLESHFVTDKKSLVLVKIRELKRTRSTAKKIRSRFAKMFKQDGNKINLRKLKFKLPLGDNDAVLGFALPYTNSIFVTPDFFDQDEATRSGTLVHEAVHMIGEFGHNGPTDPYRIGGYIQGLFKDRK